jgi:hypothetical protein
MTAELLLDGRLRGRGIFQPREVARLWDEHRTGRAEHPHRLWQLVMLELWFRRFIDEAPAPAGAAAIAATSNTHARQDATSLACVGETSDSPHGPAEAGRHGRRTLTEAM